MDSGQDLAEMPALSPPDNIVSNYDNPYSLYPWLLAVGVISMALMTLAVAIRIYTKVFILKSVKHEDYIAVLALAGFLVWDVIFIYVSKLGLARNQWDIRAVDIPYFLKMMNVIEIIYGPSMLFAKYFVLIQLKRIFVPTNLRNSVWWIIYSLIGATIAYYVACTFTFIFQCWPREAIWNTALEAEATCIDFKAATLVSGVINMVLDIGIFLTPLYAIWLLQMPMKRKIGVFAVFGVGFLTCVITVFGVAFRVPLLTSQNLTMAIAKVGLFTFAEYFGTILVGSMPLFPRFWSRFTGRQPPESRYAKGSISQSHITERSVSHPSTRTGYSSQSSNKNPMRHAPYDELPEDDPHDLQQWEHAV